MAALIPIPTLDPESIPPPDKAIRAVVSLYWPYSSSTKQCALLLADRDFRLRSRKGQVRVRFTSASATAVAQGKVGIGDEVLLDLRGAQWASDSSRVATPGKSVEGELVYKGQLSLRIVKKAGSSENVDHHLSVNESTPPPEEEAPQAKQTPARNTRVSSLRSSLGGVDLVPIYSSPAFVRRQRLSGNNLVKEDVFDPFADVDRELENEQPRKRQRISDVSSWRFTDRSPSPEKQMPVENASDSMDVDASTAVIGQHEGDPQLSAKSRPSDAGHDLQQSSVKASIDDGLKDTGPLPAKLSPLPRAASEPDVQAQDATTMLPPPLPKLQMPHDPFVVQPQDSQHNPDLPLEGPATPKLKAVPGYTLPLPSPFPQEAAQTPFESKIAAAKTAPNSNATKGSQNAMSESTYDDGVRLQINPSITALARQRRKALRSGRQNSENPAPADTTRSSSQPNSASQDDLNYVYPDIESANDTEEDEDMQNMYSQQMQSHARELLAREGVKTRDWVHQTEADEVIEDMGDEPGTSSEEDFEDFEEDESDESDEDDEMLSLQDEEEGNSQTPTALPETAAVLQLRHSPKPATKDDEALIDVSSRPSAQKVETAEGRTPLSGSILQQSKSQVGATLVKPSVAREPLTEAKKEPVEPKHVSTPSVPVITIKESSRALPPKTPAKTMRSLFGFSYGMDGTNDTPPLASKPTPQSERDQIMKKTYSSLFGFRASQSPEKERLPTPTPEAPEPETTFGRVKAAGKSQDMVSGVTMDDGNAQQVPAALEADGRPSPSSATDQPVRTTPVAASPSATVSPDNALSRHVDIEVMEAVAEVEASHDPDGSEVSHTQEVLEEDEANESPESTIPESTPSQFAIDVDDTFDSLDVQLSGMSQPNQTPPAVEETQQPTLPDPTEPHVEANRTAAGINYFDSLDVQLSEVSDADENAEDEVVSQGDPLHSKRAGARAVHEPQPTQDTSIVTEPVKLADSADTSTPHATIAPVDVHPASQPVETDEPFDDEALVASMLNDATPRPLRTTQHDDIDMSPDTSAARPVSREEIKLEPMESLTGATRRAMPPPPSTAPVRSLGSGKIHAAPSSTAPRPSQVEVIDLGSSDDSDVDAQSDDDQDEEEASIDKQEYEHSVHDDDGSAIPPASHPQRASQITSQDLMIDEPDGAQAYSPTEVASSPGALDTVDVEMQDATSQQGDVGAHSQSSFGVPQRVEDEPLIPDAQHESFFEDEMEASGFEAPGPVPQHSQRQSQMSEAPSTQSRNIADQYHYFSFQNDSSDIASSDDEDGDNELPSQISPSKDAIVKEEVGQPKSTAQSEVIEISSSSPPPVIGQPIIGFSEVKVAQSSEQSQVQRSQNETSPQVLVSSADQATPPQQPALIETEVNHTPEVQVAASSFVEDSMDTARQPETQLSLDARLPSPENSQVSQPTSALESQHRLESQPFETQLPYPSHQAILPPTPEVTNEGLKVVVDTPQEPTPTTPAAPSTRKHKRNTSSKDISAPVRRSPRKADVQNEERTASPGASQVVTTRQTRSQRTASPEAAQVATTRQTRSQRTATPEAVHAATSSFDSTLRTPEPAKPLRRSPRKSKAQTESFESINEMDVDNAEGKSGLSATRRSSRKSVDISPPPKRVTPSEKDDLNLNQQPAMEPAPLSSKKTPSKKSFTSRFGNVPEVISAWFSPRRSTRPSLDEENITNEKPELLQRISSNGIVTSSAYYTPLSNLDEKLNPSSQPGVDNTIDILAVVADETKAPERAKGGPKDYFTIFKIVDPSSLESKTFTSVDVFRPWHATLPVAKVGDVVLLRGFAVKSRKRQPHLLSTDASAWLVWRFDEGDTAKRPGTATSPRRTRRSSVVGLGAREETKGPPVEIGEEERQRAKELRAWWSGLSSEEKGELSK